MKMLSQENLIIHDMILEAGLKAADQETDPADRLAVIALAYCMADKAAAWDTRRFLFEENGINVYEITDHRGSEEANKAWTDFVYSKERNAEEFTEAIQTAALKVKKECVEVAGIMTTEHEFWKNIFWNACAWR